MLKENRNLSRKRITGSGFIFLVCNSEQPLRENDLWKGVLALYIRIVV